VVQDWTFPVSECWNEAQKSAIVGASFGMSKINAKLTGNSLRQSDRHGVSNHLNPFSLCTDKDKIIGKGLKTGTFPDGQWTIFVWVEKIT